MVTIDNHGDKQEEFQWPEGLHKLFSGTGNLLEQKDQESYITTNKKHQKCKSWKVACLYICNIVSSSTFVEQKDQEVYRTIQQKH